MVEELNLKLEQLQQEFLRALPARIERLRGCLGEGRCDRQTLQSELHQLAGSGASYGLPALGEAARAMELFLVALPAAENPPPPAYAKLGDLFEQLTAASRAAPLAMAAAPAIGRKDSGGAETPILLVEDDVEQARYIQVQLSHFNYRVEILDSPEGVAAALETLRPVALLMDIDFPGGELAGPDHLAGLMARGVALPPVIYLTTRTAFEARLAAVRGGGRAFFVKPAEVSRIADRLDVLLNKREPEPYRVLIVEDSVSLAAFYAAVLEQQGMTTRTVTDPLEAMDALAEFAAELILMDMYMPGCSGIELANVLRQQDLFVGIPIVFLSAETNLDKHHEAMSIGGDDFLVKPIQPDRLVGSVTARVDRYRVLRDFMLRDGLTGLLNHTTTSQHLERELARAERQKSPLAVAMIDIDHFKKVNDTHGHAVGDQVIRALSRLLQQRLRKSDVVGRFGGEEFVAILPDTTGEVALQVIDGIRQAFTELVQHADETQFHVSFSGGVSSLGQTGKTSLLEAADHGLYESKRGGRNRVTLFKPD